MEQHDEDIIEQAERFLSWTPESYEEEPRHYSQIEFKPVEGMPDCLAPCIHECYDPMPMSQLTRREFDELAKRAYAYYQQVPDEAIERNNRRAAVRYYEWQAEESRKRQGQYQRPKTPAVRPGWIYVLKSDYGHKVGRSEEKPDTGKIRIMAIDQARNAEMLFTFQVEHENFLQVYNRITRQLKDQNKHIDGAWYRLEEGDLESIRAIGSTP